MTHSNRFSSSGGEDGNYINLFSDSSVTYSNRFNYSGLEGVGGGGNLFSDLL